MRCKVKVWAFLLCVSLLFSCIFGGTPMVAQAEETMMYEGNAGEVAAVSSGDNSGMQIVLPDGAVQVYGQEVTFDSTSDWDDKGEYNIALTTTEALHAGAYVTMDVLVPEEANYSGIIKVQGIARLGSNWTWTECSTIPEFAVGDLTSTANGYKSVSIRFNFGEEIEADALAQFTIKLAGYQCDYSGAIYIANVKLVDGGAENITATLPDGAVRVYDQDVTFDVASTWDDKGEYNIALTTTEALHAGAYVTMDVMVPEAADYTGVIKVQGIARLGSNWSWTQCATISELAVGDFTSAGNGYKSASIRFDFGEEIEADALAQFTIKLAGWQCNYSGAVYLANVKLVDASSEGDNPDTNTPVAEIADRTQVYGQEVTFDSTSDWDDKGEYNIALTTTEALHAGAYVTMDVLVPEAVDYTGVIKVQGIARLGSNWSWTQCATIPELAVGDFTSAGNGYKSASIRFDFGEEIEADALAQFTIKLAGWQCNYSGAVYLANVKLYDGASSGGSSVLPEKEPSLIDDFEDGTCEDWVNVGGWQYDGDIATDVVDYNGSKMMKVELDYTGMGEYSWSEAKVQNTFAESYDVSAYNLLTFEYYYPSEFAGSKLKLFANGLLNGEAEIAEEEVLSDGYKKAEAKMKFSPSDAGLVDLTLGFVGVNTEFVGCVYVDNITLSQYDANQDYVEITSVPEEGADADISKAPASVKLADASADDSARALYAYLLSLKESNQVLFGHQNDYNKMVSSSATQGDVKEITGSLSGIYGVDSLTLTGAELGLTDAQQALEKAIELSISAAEGGSIISLSTHMPNFTNDKITVNADGSYDFTSCNFVECKDLSGNCAEQILPGGAYNAQFIAYLDIIAEYAKALQERDIPILFRPFHENNGNWFWWGTGISAETYKSMFRYMEDYLCQQGVHNLVYVYSPNGPFSSANEYMERYPGNQYVDIMAFDYYDDYYSYPATADGSFFAKLKTTCQTVSALAEENGKIAAISETGVRAMKKNGSDMEGLLVTGNPVAKSKTGVNWYQKVSDIAAECDMPYWLVWANFSDTNFYVPYKYNDTHGHEMINEFIDFYNCDNAIFGNGTNFYGQLGSVAGETYTTPRGYMIMPFERTILKEDTLLRGSVMNATNVSFVVKNTLMGTEVTLAGSKVVDSSLNLYEAQFTVEQMEQLGATDAATISLVADGVVLATVGNICFGVEANIIENFDYYGSGEELLQSEYATNSADGCSSEFTLSAENKSEGTYGGAFHYSLNTDESEVWTGQIKTLYSANFSDYNSITMWVKPDGKSQKVVIQLADSSGEEFEAYLTSFVSSTEAKYITIPFSSFKGKQNGTLNTAEITKFAIWCNSIIPEGYTGEWKVDSVLYFDGIKAFSAGEELLALTNENGLIITDKCPDTAEEDSEEPVNTPAPTAVPTEAPTATPEPTAVPTEAPEPTVVPTEEPTVTPIPNVSVEEVMQEAAQVIHGIMNAENITEVVDIITDFVQRICGLWINTAVVDARAMDALANVEEQLEERGAGVSIHSNEGNTFGIQDIDNALLTVPEGGTLNVDAATLEEGQIIAAEGLGVSAEQMAGAEVFALSLVDNITHEIRQLATPVRIYFSIPERMSGKELKLVHYISDEQAELLDVDENGNTGSAVIRSFSEFLLVEDIGSDSSDNASDTDTVVDAVIDKVIGAISPKMGDETGAMSVLLISIFGVLCAVTAVTGMMIFRKKKDEE